MRVFGTEMLEGGKGFPVTETLSGCLDFGVWVRMPPCPPAPPWCIYDWEYLGCPGNRPESDQRKQLGFKARSCVSRHPGFTIWDSFQKSKVVSCPRSGGT